MVLLYFALWLVKKVTQLSQPIRCKSKTNHDLVARVFPRFRQFGYFYFEFSLALKVVFLSYNYNWSLKTFNRKRLSFLRKCLVSESQSVQSLNRRASTEPDEYTFTNLNFRLICSIFQGNIMNRTILLSLLMIVIIVLSLTAECRARGCNYSFGNKRVAARKCKKHKRTKARFNDDLSSLQFERWAGL